MCLVIGMEISSSVTFLGLALFIDIIIIIRRCQYAYNNENWRDDYHLSKIITIFLILNNDATKTTVSP